jgi:hypothetical protein
MIKSDETYFLFSDGDRFKCYVSAEDVNFYHRITEPTSIELTVEEVYEEEFCSPDFEFSEDDFRIFDYTFDESFN